MFTPSPKPRQPQSSPSAQTDTDDKLKNLAVSPPDAKFDFKATIDDKSIVSANPAIASKEKPEGKSASDIVAGAVAGAQVGNALAGQVKGGIAGVFARVAGTIVGAIVGAAAFADKPVTPKSRLPGDATTKAPPPPIDPDKD